MAYYLSSVFPGYIFVTTPLWTLLLPTVIAIAVFWWMWRKLNKPPPANDDKSRYWVGDLTLPTLRCYAGYDWTKPLLVAVKGRIYNVTDDYNTYGPGRPKGMYAGRDITRALAADSLDEKHLGLGGDLTGLSESQLDRLEEQVAEFDKRYMVVGRLVPLRKLTLEELARHDGTDPSLPLFLAIKGTVYDITAGKDFYGPDGIYPFAGKEVARAFALFSTDVADCNDNLEGLSYTEKESLREWIEKFNSKYPVVGRIVQAKEPGQQQQAESEPQQQPTSAATEEEKKEQ